MKRNLLFTAMLAMPMFITGTLAYAHGDQKDTPVTQSVEEQTDWGIAGKPAWVTRTVQIDMTDAMRFTPDKITVKQGEIVRFVVTNKGRMLHEMVIGTPEKLAEHAALMIKFPGMQHSEPYMVHVPPGKTGEIVWNFNRPGTFEFACLIAGHYEAGMRGTLTVTPTLKQGDTDMNSKLNVAMVPLVLGLATASAVQAETVGTPAVKVAEAAKSEALSEGVVRKIDAASGKITLKHGPLVNLAMPAMTMVFKVQPPDLLNAVKVGDTVKFRAENLKGALTVTAIEPGTQK
jgi:uncharacterized cupredoxin-like copper-binding protein/Cu/Ag efflux protein CusF